MIKYNQTNIKLSDGELKAIKDIIETGEVVNGKFTKLLEQSLEISTGVEYAIACANCTTGLIIALKALGLQSKTIAVPAFTWFSTPYAITCNYNIPSFIDINKNTWLMEEFDHNYVDAIVSVDILGSRSFVDTTLPIIYDAAHGFGIPDLGHRGIVEVLSLSYTKVVQGMQGGAILTNDKEIAEKCRLMVHRYGKITEINALVAQKSLDDWSTNQAARENIIQQYRESIKVPFVEQETDFTNYSVYSLLFETNKLRDKIRHALDKNDVETKIYYQPTVEDNDYFKRRVPTSFDIFYRSLSLPVYPGLGENQVEFISSTINGAI